MSLTYDDNGPVHMPNDPNKFVFDAEVAECFENMAYRSIPAYQESHRICCELASQIIDERVMHTGAANIIDIGTSTGAFFKGIWETRRVPYDNHINGLVAIAIDSSQPMIDIVRKDLPHVMPHVMDVLDLDPSVYPSRFDVINISYLVQFLRPDVRFIFWKRIERMLAPGGFVFVSTKDEIEDSTLRTFFDGEYFKFRKRNGYTEEEIRAKTKALRGSMFTELHHDLSLTMAQVGLGQQQEVCRWLHFCTLVAQKTGHVHD